MKKLIDWREFTRGIAAIINKFGVDALLDEPDYMLAEYVSAFLKGWGAKSAQDAVEWKLLLKQIKNTRFGISNKINKAIK